MFEVDERVAPDGDPDRNLGDLRANLLDLVPVVAHLMDVTAADLHGGVLGGTRTSSTRSRATVCSTSCISVSATTDTPRRGRRAIPVIDVTDVDVAITQPYRGRVRMTLTVPAVNRARSVMFLAAGGPGKSEMVKRLVARDRSIPATPRPAPTRRC